MKRQRQASRLRDIWKRLEKSNKEEGKLVSQWAAVCLYIIENTRFYYVAEEWWNDTSVRRDISKKTLDKDLSGDLKYIDDVFNKIAVHKRSLSSKKALKDPARTYIPLHGPYDPLLVSPRTRNEYSGRKIKRKSLYRMERAYYNLMSFPSDYNGRYWQWNGNKRLPRPLSSIPEYTQTGVYSIEYRHKKWRNRLDKKGNLIDPVPS